MEEIIRKLQEEEAIKGTEEGIPSAHESEHKAVKEAMEEGLLQPHGILPNSKQDRIFRILCKNPNDKIMLTMCHHNRKFMVCN